MSVGTDKTNGTGKTSTASATSDVREFIIHELRAEDLSKEEQDQLMQEVGNALWERATFALMKNVPPEVLIEFAESDKDPQEAANAALFMQRVAETVPNAQQIVVDAIRAGLRDYQEYLDKEIAQGDAHTSQS